MQHMVAIIYHSIKITMMTLKQSILSNKPIKTSTRIHCAKLVATVRKDGSVGSSLEIQRNVQSSTVRVEQVAVQVNTEQGQPQQRSRLEFKPGSVRPRSPKTEETASMVLPTGRGRGWKKTHTARRAHPISTMSARVVIQT